MRRPPPLAAYVTLCEALSLCMRVKSVCAQVHPTETFLHNATMRTRVHTHTHTTTSPLAAQHCSLPSRSLPTTRPTILPSVSGSAEYILSVRQFFLPSAGRAEGCRSERGAATSAGLRP